MARLTGFLAAAAIVGSTATSVSAQTPAVRTVVFTPVAQQARVSSGSIQGVVSDERGGPLAGAIVSVLGLTPAMATTDSRGRFAIQQLAPGSYALRVHLAGFAASRRDAVRVGPAAVDVAQIQMRRVGEAAALPAHPILTAGVSLPSGENPGADDDNHTETAWRLRHIKRGVLKQDGDVVSIADAASEQPLPPP
ncbi:MAG: carboxypeptidase-like regulatory domain-containing protein, partial [Vicinamibacterales bacterium]